MKKCGDGCYDVCDFCIHLDRETGEPDAGYTLCRKLNILTEWSSSCEDFHCFRVKDGEN